MKRVLPVQTAAGVALMALATVVLLGWVLQQPAMVRLHPQFVAMVSSTALCFLLLGFAFVTSAGRPGRHLAVRTGAGLAVIAISLPPLLATLVDIDLVLDFRDFHAWVGDSNPRPGRMAPNTAIGFILAGLVLVLAPRVSSKLSATVVQVATMLVLLLGLTGLVGYALQLDLLYPSFKASRMAVHTALGMIVTGLALWHGWHGRDWYQGRHYFHDVEKIAFVGTALLVMVGATAGVAGLAAQQTTLERNFADSLRMDLHSRVASLNSELNSRIAQARNTAALLQLLGLPRAPEANVGPTAATALQRAAARLLSADTSAISVLDAAGLEILRAGQFAEQPPIAAALALEVPATLLWADGFLLRIVVPMLDSGRQVGTLTLESKLPLGEQLLSAEGLGETGEVGLCIPVNEQQVRCFPQFRNPRVYQANRRSKNGKYTPIGLALQGRSGAFNGLDYRGNNVLAAYQSLAATGLGFVVKKDTQELFRPIRTSLQWTVPLLLLTIGVGTVLLRLQVKPLAARLMQFERTVIDSETEIRTVVESVGDGIITLDEFSRIRSINGAATRIFGYAPDELIGTRIEALMPAERRSAHAHGMQRYLSGGAPAVIGQQNMELPGLRKEGSIFPLELTVNEMQAGGRRLFVGIVRDITERKAVEIALQQRNAELEALNAKLVNTQNQLVQSEKMSSIGQLAAGVAHEINNPVGYVFSNFGSLERYVAKLVTVLQAYAELEHELPPDNATLRAVWQLKDSIELDFLIKDMSSLVSESREGLERVRKIVQDLKDFSHIEAPEWQLADLHLGLESTLNIVAHELKYKAEVIRDYGELPLVRCLPFQINQVFLNLLVNASQAIQAHGRITVRTRRADDEVVIQIADDGSGIAAANLARIFEPFFTTKPIGVGTGLGLSVSWGIVQTHGGRIEVQSTPGAGTEFTVRLPIQPPSDNLGESA